MARPKVVVTLSSKGGVGKSSMSAHLVTMTGGKAALIDSDKQESCGKWIKRREAAGINDVVFFSYEDFVNYGVDSLLEQAEEAKCDYVVIDTPPHSHPATVGILKQANVILIPTEASMLALDAIGDTLRLAKAASKQTVIALNKVEPNEIETKEALQALAALKMPVVTIQNRVAFKRALPSGLTAVEYKANKKAIEEIQNLWNTIHGVMQ